MVRGPFPCGLAMIVAAGTLLGCSSHTDGGSVFVKVRPVASQGRSISYDVTVRSSEPEVVTSREVSTGSSIEIEAVPFGWVSIEAATLCTVESELSAESPSIRLVIDERSCTLAE